MNTVTRLPLLAVLPLALCLAVSLGPGAEAQSMRASPEGSSAGSVTSIAFAPGVDSQLYAADKSGRIFVVRGGNYLNQPFIDIRSDVNNVGEGGLLGLVFDPDFQTNGHFYISYVTGTGPAAAVVSRFSVMPGSVDVADPMSEQILFGPYPQTTDRHKGGDLAFGPDGMLYFSLGDSGDMAPAAQDVSSALGKVHRIDVDMPFPHVPADNPFVGVAGAQETVWALGFRNPYRIDLDPATGDLYVADVGESTWEEISRIPAGMGGANGGWPCFEGDQCFGGTACSCSDPSLLAPFVQLSHSAPDMSCSVIGGLVYRGSAIPGLVGQYVFTDFCTGRFYRVENPTSASPILVDETAQVNDGTGGGINLVGDFCRDNQGEIWFAEHYSASLWRLLPDGGFGIYCPTPSNSSGSAAGLVLGGSPSIAAANLTLSVAGLPAQALGFFLVSNTQANVPGFGGSQGTLCVGQPISRWSSIVLNSGASGQVSLQTDLSNLPATVSVTPGSTWNFQYWTRDANPGPTSNTSNGAYVTFTP